MTYKLARRESDPGLPAKGKQVVDRYCDWDASDGKDFSVISRLDAAIQRRDASSEATFGPILVVEKQRTGKGNKTRKVKRVYRLPVERRSIRADAVDSGKAKIKVNLSDDVPAHALHPDADPDAMVITAVIDSGINPANMRFRCLDQGQSPNRSRIDYFWAQNADTRPDEAQLFGANFDRESIEAAIAQYPQDELEMMAALGLIKPTYEDFNSARHVVGHGTHVLDIAAGHAPDENEKDHRIIAVQLPDLVTADTSGSTLPAVAIAALVFVFERAMAISAAAGRAVPLVLNFSYGLGAGPHDGSHPIEAAMRVLLNKYMSQMARRHNLASKDDVPVHIVLPSGNRRLAQGHAMAVAGKSGKATLAVPLRVQPSDQSSNYLEFWVPDGGKVSKISVTPPGSDAPLVWKKPATPKTARKVKERDILRDGAVIGRISVDRPYSPRDANGCRPLRVLIALAGTESWNTDAVCPAGIWQVKVAVRGAGSGDALHAWVQRDDEALALSTGARASFLDDEAYETDRLTDRGAVRVDDPNPVKSVVRRDGSISSIATRPHGQGLLEDRIFVIGGKTLQFDTGTAEQRNIATYSGDGDAGAAQRCAVSVADATLPSERSEIRAGIRAAGMLSGSTFALRGTSVAAPQKARELAGKSPLDLNMNLDGYY